MIYHLALQEDWAAAKESGTYAISTRGVDLDSAAFIHGSGSAAQALSVWGFVYADRPDVVVLSMQEADLEGAGLSVRWEPGDPADPQSETFPHIYGGPLPVTLCTEVQGGIEAIRREALAD